MSRDNVKRVNEIIYEAGIIRGAIAAPVRAMGAVAKAPGAAISGVGRGIGAVAKAPGRAISGIGRKIAGVNASIEEELEEGTEVDETLQEINKFARQQGRRIGMGMKKLAPASKYKTPSVNVFSSVEEELEEAADEE